MSNTGHVQTGFIETNGTTLYYEVAGAGHPFILIHGHLLDRQSWDDQFAVFARAYRVVRYDQRGFGDSGLIVRGKPYSDRQDLYELMKSLGIESAYPDVVRLYSGLNEAFEQHDIARAVDISLELWTDGPGRLPGQAAPEVRERVREMTTRNWERPDDEAQSETPPMPLEPPAVGRLASIGAPTLIILGEWDAPNPLDQLAAQIPGARKVVMAGTAHHPFMEKPAEFNQIVLDFLGSLQS